MATQDDEGDLKHVWVRYLIMPVNAFMGEDGEAYLEYDKAALQETLSEPDLRVGCLTCHTTLDDGWGTPCPGVDLTQLLPTEDEADG